MIFDPHLNLLKVGLLFGTAFISGGLNAIAGGGSFITFPTLIFTGIDPIVANATNNTAMWIAAIASAKAYQQDLVVERRELFLLCGVSLVGSLVSAIALFFTSPILFKKLIPYLLLAATLLFTFSEPLKNWFLSKRERSKSEQNQARSATPSLNLLLIQFVIAVYGGFFGAGIGILMLASLTFLGNKTIHQTNALKTFLVSCINGIAIFPFVLAQVISWQEVVVMAIAGSLGSYLIANYARSLAPSMVKAFVILIGFSMSAYFFIKN
jgi:uncharacterized protein